jgi:type II secretory ATPase GspE/PulE/Tfp pilus assembly ATPase PilB-like protein
MLKRKHQGRKTLADFASRLRPFAPLLVAAAIILIGTTSAFAGLQSEADYLIKSTWRTGTGFYIGWGKIAATWLLFLGWIVAADWVNRDIDEQGLDARKWNPIIVGTFMAVMILTWLIPWFWLNIFLLLGGAAAPIGVYIFDRNKHVGYHDQVMTPAHIRSVVAGMVNKLGGKMSSEKADPNESGVPVKTFGRGGKDKIADGANLLSARQAPGLPEARKILYSGLAARASAIVLDFGQANVALRYMVDGVWMPQEPLERETADPALEALKILCGLKADERRARQEGKFGVEYSVLRKEVFQNVDNAEKAFREKLTLTLTKKMASEELQPPQLQVEVAKAVEEQARAKFASPVGEWTPVDKEALPTLPGIEPINAHISLSAVKCPCTFTAQGTQAGERVIIQFEHKVTHLTTPEQLGMRAKMQEQLFEVLNREKGLVVFSAPPANGLRTTTKVLIFTLDRFIREFVAVEDESNRYEDVENCPVTTYKSAEGQSPVDVFPKLFRQQPNVIVVRDAVNAASLKALCDEVLEHDRMAITTVRAKDTAEALLRTYALDKTGVKEFAREVSGVLCQRLVRLLCDKCKEPYAPPPEVLQQLGIPAGKVRAFYRPPQAKPGDDEKEVCRECGGIGYRAQTAIFELMVIDDTIRNTLAKTPKLDLLRAAARKAGAKTLQEEGILLVARGATSLPELMRVLKG